MEYETVIVGLKTTVGGKRLRWCHHSVTLGTFYSQVAFVNSLKLTSITRCRVAWGKFNEPLPVLTSRPFPITSIGRVYNSCMRNEMVHASQAWAPTSSDLHRLQRNDRAMIRSMYSSSQLARSPGEDAAWRSGKGTSHPPTQMARRCRT